MTFTGKSLTFNGILKCGLLVQSEVIHNIGFSDIDMTTALFKYTLLFHYDLSVVIQYSEILQM